MISRYQRDSKREPMRKITFAAPAILLLLTAIYHPSDIIAQQQQTEEEPDRWSFVVDVSYTGYSGNRSLSLLTSGFSLTHLQEELFEFELSGQVDYGRSKGDSDAADYLINASTSLAAELSEKLSLKITHRFTRNTRVPAGISMDDHKFMTGLSINF